MNSLRQQQFKIQDKRIARNAISAIKHLFADAEVLDSPIVVELKPYKKDRSLSQNRLSHLWYKERAEQQGSTPDYEHRYCKLRYGCPILLAEDEDFARIFNQVIKPLDYEDRIKAMKYLPVTRLFNTKQMAEYLTTIERESVQTGIALTCPADIYEEAMGRRR